MLGMNFSSFWDIFAIPFGYVMQGLNFICGRHYLLALLLFSLVVKLVTLPVSIKQQKSQIKGAMLRPKISLIEKKYAGRNDQKTLQKKQQEIMDLQQKEGYSPLAGCLPMLLQFPVIIGLYRIIRMPLKYVMNLGDTTIVDMYNKFFNPEVAIEKLDKIPTYAQVDMIGMIQKDSSLLDGFVDNAAEFISKLPNFNLFGLNAGIQPTLSPVKNGLEPIYWLFILIPIISGALNYLSMWISRKLNDNGMNEAASNPQQKSSMTMMTLMMPLMSVWIAFIVPAAVGIYWIYSSVFSLIQTIILSKVMPLPKYTEEEIRAMQREIKAGRSERTITSSSVDSEGRPHSLHYVDDDDEY
jgi:YidC/Oxa1 family membrane protein insertase